MNEEIDDTPVGNWARQSYPVSFKNGVKTDLHLQDREIITTKSYDPEPFTRLAHDMQVANEGRKLDDGFHSLGRMPEAEFSRAIREGWAYDMDKVMEWFRDRPDLQHNKKLIKR